MPEPNDDTPGAGTAAVAPSPPAAPGRRPPYWRRHLDGNGRWRDSGGAPGAELAALRRGIGREPGSVPAMWPYYTTLSEDGSLTPSLRAEHLVLTLYAVHQQSRPGPMHQRGIGVGTALQALRRSEKFSPEAVDRRFSAAATATSLGEVAAHLRGLITQLRAIGQGLDYDLLVRDLVNWQNPERRLGVRRRWGGQYFIAVPRDDGEPAGS